MKLTLKQDIWDPAHDSAIFHTYSVQDLGEKKKNKDALQKLLGLHVSPKMLLLSVVGSFTKQHGLEHVMHIAKGVAEIGGQLIILVPSHEVEKWQKNLRPFHDVIAVTNEDEKNIHRVLAGSDALVLPAASSHAPAIALRYGTVPIAPLQSDAELHDYDPRTESGNAFLYAPGSVWSMYAGIVRAIETHKLPYDWKGLQRNGMKADIDLEDSEEFLSLE